MHRNKLHIRVHALGEDRPRLFRGKGVLDPLHRNDNPTQRCSPVVSLRRGVEKRFKVAGGRLRWRSRVDGAKGQVRCFRMQS